jgi:putative nucleotidyltransferase with HDIG domain
MFSSFELSSQDRGEVVSNPRNPPVEWRRETETFTARDEAPIRLLRYLPLAVFATTSVVVLPAVLVAMLVSRGNWLLMGASAALTIGASVAIASVEAAMWTRRRGSRDLVFAELMLWGWVRRCWTERRLAEARALYDSVTKAGSTVSIELLESLSERLHARDAYTHGHNQRVARHAESIARAMRLPPTQVAKIRTAAAVHDVGKIYTPREILNNPGSLNDREYAIVKLHAGDGADMLETAGDPEITAIVRHHHERVDGRGYPDGLLGSDIPLGARIIAVADTFDAITSNRPYRPGSSHKQALMILSEQAGSQLDSAAVGAFLSCYSSRRSIAWFAFAAVIPQRIFAVLQTASPSIGVGGGVTSILPALGAASLLTLSPVVGHDTGIEQGARRRPAVARSHQRAIPVTQPAHGTRRSSGPTASTRAPQPGRGRTHTTVHIPVAHTPLAPVATPVSTRGTADTPSAPTPTGGTAGAREPVATTPAAPPTTGSPAPPPTAPPATPPASPPTDEAPKLPEPPTNLPVKLPSIPVPSIPVPSIPVPSIPSLPIPKVVASTTEALGVKIP